MEPAVRGARIEPAIIAARLETAFFASRDPEFPNCQTAFCRSKPGRRERNFWKQRPEAKNPPERPLLPAETGNLKIGMKNPRRNGLFSIGDGFCGSGRLRGGVRSQIRPGLHLEFPNNRHFTGNFRQKLLVLRIWP